MEEYGSIEEAFVALDDDCNGVLDLVMLRKKFEVILGGGEGRRAEMYQVQQPLESQVRNLSCAPNSGKLQRGNFNDCHHCTLDGMIIWMLCQSIVYTNPEE